MATNCHQRFAMTACDILNQDRQRKGADSCLAIRHKDAMTDDEIIFAVEAFAFDAGPVTAERRNRGFTLFHVATGKRPSHACARSKGMTGCSTSFIGRCGRNAGSTSAPLAARPPRSTRRCASSPKPQFSGSPRKIKIKNAQSRAKATPKNLNMTDMCPSASVTMAYVSLGSAARFSSRNASIASLRRGAASSQSVRKEAMIRTSYEAVTALTFQLDQWGRLTG